MELLQQIRDFIIPELDAIRQEQSAVRERLNAIDLHLVDQSRRIDKVHDDLLARIDGTPPAHGPALRGDRAAG